MIAIEQLTGIRYPLSFLLENATIAEQAIALKKRLSNPDQLLLTTLSSHANVITLYIAASGNGDYLRFSNLADALGNVCSLHMLQPPETKDNKQSIYSIAQCYADLIIQHSNSPFYISGFSIGGITALETARILVEKGRTPQGILLLDSIYPRWPLQSPLLFKLIRHLVSLLNLSKTMVNNRRLEVMLSDPGIKAQLFALPELNVQSAELPVDLILTKGMWMFHPLFFSTWSRLFKNQLTLHSTKGLHGGIFRTPHLEGLTKIKKHIVTSNKSGDEAKKIH
jgi:surfactin synthase thioesterase subunit